MKKISLISLMMLLIVNSFVGSLNVKAETEVSDQSFVLSEPQIESVDGKEVKVKYDWTFIADEGNGEKIYSFPVPAEVTVAQEQTGELLTSQSNSELINESQDELTNEPKGELTSDSIGETENVNNEPQGELPSQPEDDSNTIEEIDSATDLTNGVENDSTDEGSNESNDGLPNEEIDEPTNLPVDVPTSNTPTAIGSYKVTTSGDIIITINEGQEKNTTGCFEFTALAGKETRSTIITENILTDAELTFEDKIGNPVEGVDQESIIVVKYKWALPNGHGYKAGATFNFNLPPELTVYEEVTNEPLKFGADTLGTFTVKMNGEVTVVFNDFIENHSNISGTMEVISKISEQVIVTEERVVKVTPIQGGISKDIPIIFHPSGSTIDKKGIPNKSYNTEKIEWTVDFNKNLDTIKNAVLSDPIQAGQELEADSIKVFEIVTRLDGSVELGKEVTSAVNIGKMENGKDFKVNLGEIISAYRVVYTTKITDQDKTKFDNKATLSGEDFSDIEASASVGVKRGVALAKKSTGYDEATQTITWEIKYNYNEKSIPQADALLKDFFNNTQELVKKSDGTFDFIVKKITIDENGNESGSGEVFTNYTITPKKSTDNRNGFELQFNQDIHEAYKITYKTRAIDRVFDWEKITNEVESGEHKTSGTRDIYQQILYKSNYKDHPYTDYNKKTTTWMISFNIDSHLMKDVKLVDTFLNKGLTLIPETLRITTQGKELVKDTDYKLINKGEDGFEIEFLHEISTPHYIQYETNFNYDAREDKNKDYLNNKAVITWIDESSEEKSKEATATFTLDSYTKSNGFKHGSYNAVTKEITWSIGINYNLRTLAAASVVDEIQGNQIIDQNSLKVYKMTLTGGENGTKQEEAVENSDYEIVWDPTGQPGFRVNFLKEINSAYLIEYKTSLEDQLIKEKYDNKATLYNNTVKVTDVTASVSVLNGGKYTGKTGEQKGKIIDWNIEINFGQSKVSNAKVVDTPSENQIPLEQSFHLYSTIVGENGSVKKGKELEQGTDYTLEFTNDGFVLAFKEDIDKPYILAYQSLILAKVGDTVHNDVKFTGDQITIETTESKSSLTVKRTTGIGTGTGEVGSLEIIKVDANNPEKFLEGAIFSLIDEVSGAVIKTLTTGADGKVKFEKLLYGEYLLKEDQAPKGYVVGINGTEIVNINQPEDSLTIKNEKIYQAVELTKFAKDEEDNKIYLAGAEFELQIENSEGNYEKVEMEGNPFKTNDNGKITVNNLEPGNYQFVEITAPEHYLLDEDPVNFTIVKNQTSIVSVEKENKRGNGNIEIEKVDGSTNKKPLAGAEFELYNSEGEKIGETVITAEDGKAVFEDLPYDHYVLKEVKAPVGYVISKSSENIDVTLDEEVKKLEPIKNYRPSNPEKPWNPGEPNNPGTPGEPSKPKDPNKPGDPKDPKDPDKPVDSNDPKDPNQPGGSKDPKDPTNSGNPNAPGNVNNPGGSRGVGDPNNANNPNNQANGLPQTGEAANPVLPIVGLAFTLIGILLIVKRRRTDS